MDLVDKFGWQHDATRLVHDMLNRRIADLPSTQLYVAGFPCQPESSQGLRSRSNPCLQKVVSTIKQSLPLMFLLENVLGFIRGKFKRRRFVRIINGFLSCCIVVGDDLLSGLMVGGHALGLSHKLGHRRPLVLESLSVHIQRAGSALEGYSCFQ